MSCLLHVQPMACVAWQARIVDLLDQGVLLKVAGKGLQRSKNGREYQRMP